MRLSTLFLLAILVLCLGLPSGGSTPLLPTASMQKMVGESYDYSLDFLIFRDLAEGRLSLKADNVPGRYRAELVARTLGVASWLSGERTQSYVSVMEDDGTGRLRSVSHLSIIHKRKHGEWSDRRKRYRFDYQAGKVYEEKGVGGAFSPGQVFELPPGDAPVDILTGFYNLRAGAYGLPVPGKPLKIPTLTSKGAAEIVVEVLDGPERHARPFFPANGTLLRVRLDPEVFDTGEAELFAWFDEAGRPARGIVSNVIGLGDVQGRLREEKVQP